MFILAANRVAIPAGYVFFSQRGANLLRTPQRHSTYTNFVPKFCGGAGFPAFQIIQIGQIHQTSSTYSTTLLVHVDNQPLAKRGWTVPPLSSMTKLKLYTATP
jgi:hypothetical protein